MTLLLNGILSFLLSFIAYEDLKQRSFHVVSLMGCFTITLLKLIHSNPSVNTYWQFSYNIIFSFALLGLSYLLLLIRKNSPMSLDSFVGLGDILFYILLSFHFSFTNYILFLCINFQIALLYSFIFLRKKPVKQIPLAGIFSISYVLLLSVASYSGIRNFYHIPLFSII